MRCAFLSLGIRFARPDLLFNCSRKLILQQTIMPFYAVAKGLKPGIYTEWKECEKQVKGFKGPQFKKFTTKEEAQTFMEARVGNVVDKRKPSDVPSVAASNSTSSAVSNSTSAPSINSQLKTLQKDFTELRTIYDAFPDTPNLTLPNGNSSNLPTQYQLMGTQMQTIQKSLSRLRSSFDAFTQSHSTKEKSSGSQKRPASPTAEDETEAKPSKTRKIEKSADFNIDSDGCVVVYTDGCCENNGRSGARAGLGVYFGESSSLNISEPVKGRATNNTGEIQAITRALQTVKKAGFSSTVINTDSQFVINCMTNWLPGWKKRGWKKADGSEVINKEDLIDLERETEGMMVKYNYVKAHCGIHGNEMADQLAKNGSKTYKAPEK